MTVFYMLTLFLLSLGGTFFTVSFLYRKNSGLGIISLFFVTIILFVLIMYICSGIIINNHYALSASMISNVEKLIKADKADEVSFLITNNYISKRGSFYELAKAFNAELRSIK